MKCPYGPSFSAYLGPRGPLGLRSGPLSSQGPQGNPDGTSLRPNTLVRAWFVIWEKLSLFGDNQIIPKSLSPLHSTCTSSLMSGRLEYGLSLFITVHPEIFGHQAQEMDGPGTIVCNCANYNARQCHHETILVATIKGNPELRAFLTSPFSNN